MRDQTNNSQFTYAPPATKNELIDIDVTSYFDHDADPFVTHISVSLMTAAKGVAV